MTEREVKEGQVYTITPSVGHQSQCNTLILGIISLGISNTISSNKGPHGLWPQAWRHAYLQKWASCPIRRNEPCVSGGRAVVVAILEGVGDSEALGVTKETILDKPKVLGARVGHCLSR